MDERSKEELKNYLIDYVETITDRSKGKNKYICPICKSGTGAHGTGAFTIDESGTKWKCFSCGRSGDIYDLIGLNENKPTPAEQFDRAAELYGGGISAASAPPKHTERAGGQSSKPEQPTDYTNFFIQAHQNINDTDYPQRRGLSKAIIDRFNLGYIAAWTHPKSPNAPPSPRLIIPTSKYSYTARDTRSDLTEEQKRYRYGKVRNNIFNGKALATATKPIYIVEGELDALSIVEAGGEAIGTGSIANIVILLQAIKGSPPSQPLIIALDNDGAGQAAAAKLTKELDTIGTQYTTYNPAGEHKDTNEALTADRTALIKAIKEGEKMAIKAAKTAQKTAQAKAEAAAQAEAEAAAKAEAAAEAEAKEYKKSISAAGRIYGFIGDINASVNTPCISTGFSGLDNELDGGLYEGLYILGAISSLGKTAYIMQVADQIAQAGTDVLILSLEMAASELMARSISRQTTIDIISSGGNMANAKTARGITTGKRYLNYTNAEKDIIQVAEANYSEYAEHIYIIEGAGDVGTAKIREAAEKHKKMTGNTPVIIVDYLQLIAPYNERATDKQNTDKAVMELKRLSRDYKTPVIAISSLNRANYNSSISMEAFKESGAIEYSSDVLIGLQFHGAGEKDFDINAAKAARPRKIELIILKNRNGRTGEKLNYDYDQIFNYFKEI